MGVVGWPLLLLALGLLFLVAEVFVPSGGALGLLTLGCLGYGLWLAFEQSTEMGLTFVAVDAILMPVVGGAALYCWPKTKLAQRMFLKPPAPEEIAPSLSIDRPENLIGCFGRSLTPLRPSGTVDFEGRRLEGHSEHGLIDAGTVIEAVGVRSGRVVVRAARESSPEE